MCFLFTMVVCGVADCKHGNTKSVISFCRFPNKTNDKERYQVSVKRCRRKGARNVEWVPCASAWMCSEHFEETCFEPRSILCPELKFNKSFKPNAVPTLFKNQNGVSPRKFKPAPERAAFRKRRISEVNRSNIML